MWLKNAQVIAVAFLMTSCYGRPSTLHDIPPEYQPKILYSTSGVTYSGWCGTTPFRMSSNLKIDSYWRATRWTEGGSSRTLGGDLTDDEKARLQYLVQFLPRFDRHYGPDGVVFDSTSRIVTAKIGNDYVTVTVYDDPWIPNQLALLLYELNQIYWSLDEVNPELCCEVFQ